MTSSVLLAVAEFYLVVMVGEQEIYILPLVRAIPSVMPVICVNFQPLMVADYQHQLEERGPREALAEHGHFVYNLRPDRLVIVNLGTSSLAMVRLRWLLDIE